MGGGFKEQRVERLKGAGDSPQRRDSKVGVLEGGVCLFGEDGRLPSVTVFEGEVEEWRSYLAEPWGRRTDASWAMELRVVGSGKVKVLSGERGVGSAALELTKAFSDVRDRLVGWGEDLVKIYDGLVSGVGCAIKVYFSERLPCEAVPEVQFTADGAVSEDRIVVNREFFDGTKNLRGKVGLAGWLPVVAVLLLQMGHSLRPRDHFMERIWLTTRWANLMLHILCDGRSNRSLNLTDWGKVFHSCARNDDQRDKGVLLWARRVMGLVEDVIFLFGRKSLRELDEAAKVAVRDFLDRGYLRLSIEDLMPTVPEWLVPMELGDGRCRQLPKPRLGRYGILDKEDLEAWKLVAGPLRELGFVVLGQLGIGQFGRVYEAFPLQGGHLPKRVALKVDRFRKGKKREAIEAAEIIMETARGLAASPHVIRVFDAGRLRKLRMTYHVLQLVEGDTLDHLLGMAGEEHASVLRPRVANRSREDAAREVFKALSRHRGEAWRKRHRANPFKRRPGVEEVLDLLVSLALWVERVHELGFAVNDLKNGNVMVSRRGQVKGIDLDSYGRIFSAGDKLGDFIFLAVAMLQMVKRATDWEGEGWSLENHLSILGDVEGMKKFFVRGFLLRGTEDGEGGKVWEYLAAYLAFFLGACWSGEFCENARGFSGAIDELIFLRRRVGGRYLLLQ